MVQRVVPTVDRAKATVLVKIRFRARPARGARHAAKVAFLERSLAATERKAVPAVPKSAIAERDGVKYVFLVKDGRAQRVRLEGGRALGDLVQADGLTPGERGDRQAARQAGRRRAGKVSRRVNPSLIEVRNVSKSYRRGGPGRAGAARDLRSTCSAATSSP